MARTLVAGVDQSTQSTKVMIRDAQSGALVRSGVARRPVRTEISPDVWYHAFLEAVRLAGGLSDVSALSVASHQHGLVALDPEGAVIRNAILWNDTRSAPDTADLIEELAAPGETGEEGWARRVGTVPVPSLTVTKLRWMARVEPDHMAATAAIALPHDWLSWRLQQTNDISRLATDRSDASGTGYFDSVTNEYCPDLLALACGDHVARTLPRLLAPNEACGTARFGRRDVLIGAGCGDNAGAALGLDLQPGEVVVSLGTSGVVQLVSPDPTHDATGYIAGFADATGRYLPLMCTLNSAGVIDAFESMLGVDHRRFSALALAAPPGAEGLVCVPYLNGERTPNLPESTGSLLGMTTTNLTPSNIARAAVEGLLCCLGEGIWAMRRLGIDVSSVTLVGGASRSEAVQRIAPSVLGLPVRVPELGEYTADGAARQAAWALAGTPEPPPWTPRMSSEFHAPHQPFIVDRYHAVSDRIAHRHELDRVRASRN